MHSPLFQNVLNIFFNLLPFHGVLSVEVFFIQHSLLWSLRIHVTQVHYFIIQVDLLELNSTQIRVAELFRRWCLKFREFFKEPGDLDDDTEELLGLRPESHCESL